MLTPRFPYPLEKGDKLRIFHQLRYLGKEHEIHLVSLTDEEIEPKDIDKVNEYVSEISIFKLSRPHYFLSALRNVFTSKPFQVAVLHNTAIQKKIDQIVAKFQPDHIYCQLPRMAEYVKKYSFPKTIDYMDAFGVGMQRRSEVAGWPYSWIYSVEARRMKKYEEQIYPAFDHHTIISQQDAEHIAVENCEEIKVVKNGIDTLYFSPIGKEKEYDIGFVGNMGYLPNIEAAEYLINNIKPHLSDDLDFMIAGARPDKRVKHLEGKHVEITGWLDDVRLAYAKCKIFVAPLWSGTGQQNKILEAMAMGIPCVTTSSVNNAIGAEDGKEVLIADNDQEFCRAIERLLQDAVLYEEIKNNALTFVQENYSWKTSVNELNKLFELNENK
mgnify:CR=1 FL=1